MQLAQNRNSSLINISQIGPSTENFSLIFEISEILNKDEINSLIKCRIVDGTGTVIALFNDHLKLLNLETTYQMKGLRANVVQNHIQVETIGKNRSKLEILPESDSLKVLNKRYDVSEKYYASKNEINQLEAGRGRIISQKGGKGTNQVGRFQNKMQTQNRGTYSKNDQGYGAKIGSQNSKNGFVSKNQVRNQQKYSYEDLPLNKCIKPSNLQTHTSKIEQTKSSYQKKNPQVERKVHKSNFEQKPKYVEKNTSILNQKVKVGGLIDKHKYFPDPNIKQTVYLADVYKYKTKMIDIVAWVSAQKRKLPSGKDYWMGYLADQTGGMWMEFDIATEINGDAWYQISSVDVQTDKQLGCILFQRKKTQIRPWNGKVGKFDLREIKFPQSSNSTNYANKRMFT